MVIEINSIDSTDEEALIGGADGAQNNGLWNGRHIFLEEAADFQKEVDEGIRLYLHLLNQEKGRAKITWMGKILENQSFETKENGRSRELLLALAVAAGVAASKGCAGEVESAVASGLKKKEEEDFTGNQQEVDLSQLMPNNSTTLSCNQQVSSEKTPSPLMQTDVQKRGFFKSMRQNFTKAHPPLLNAQVQMIALRTPVRAPVEPVRTVVKKYYLKYSDCRLGGINGMNTTRIQAKDHENYLKQLTPYEAADWVYNKTHGAGIDLAEIFGFNYAGFSPNTAKQLKKIWEEFHHEMKYNPDLKYLQFCHSQGAIHVRNALRSSPKEIRNRVIVVAIAPAAIVPKALCFQSFNYVSEKDFIHYGEVAFAGFWDPEEFQSAPLVEKVLKDREELIVLKAHPNAGFFDLDHNFQSPTYVKAIVDHIKVHYLQVGEFK